jgi:hypothetical protein
MTPLEAIEKVAGEATGGEWQLTEPGVCSVWSESLPKTHRHTVSAPFAPFAFGEVVAASPTAADAHYIATMSPSVALELAARVRAAEEALRRIGAMPCTCHECWKKRGKHDPDGRCIVECIDDARARDVIATLSAPVTTVEARCTQARADREVTEG